MIEDKLRESFARHEALAPDVAALRRGISVLAARRRRRRVALFTGGAATAVAALLVAVTALVRQLAPIVDTLPATIGVDPVPDRAVNLLLLGLEPVEFGPALGADSIVVVHVSADRRHVYLIDLVRSLRVAIPGHGELTLNNAHRIGGAPLTATVVENLTGLTLDGTVTVTLDALRDVTDALGPVPVCVPVQMTSIHTGRTFPTGCYDLDGTAVADLTRQRGALPVGVYHRSANVLSVMIGLAHRALSLNVLTDADQIAALLRTEGITIDLPEIDALALAAQVRDVEVVGIVSPTVHSGDATYEVLDPVVATELFAALRDGTMAEFVSAHPDRAVNA